MMHKVKDVVSKFLHPSFLFSSNEDTNHSKRKRSNSLEEDADEQQIDRTTTTDTPIKHHRSVIQDDKPQLTDDEDNNTRDVLSTSPQKKRRRMANFQNILSTNGNGRTSPSSSSTDTLPILRRTTIERDLDERINRLTSSKQRYNIPSSSRGLTSYYDPSKSPLFSTSHRRTTTNEFSANQLLATGLISQPPSSTPTTQQSSATLTNPIANNKRFLSNERQVFGGNYSSMNPHRLPYIERLRRRTLQDCIRLNQTIDNEPVLMSTTEEPKSTSTSTTAPKRMKAPDKECGIQCDIPIMETSDKSRSAFPPVETQREALSILPTEKNQTASSITVEKTQPSIPIITITKPKVLGNITPFSWPKFARAQEEYAKKYPEKCRTDLVVPSIINKSNTNAIPALRQPTSVTTSTLPKSPYSLSHSAESIWKCPCCTKEHSVQTASCSLCHAINPDYKKPSAMQPTVTTNKESVSSSTLPSTISKEASIPIPVIPMTKQTTTTNDSVSFTSAAITTSVMSSTFPVFSTSPITSLTAITKVNPLSSNITTAPMFGVTPILSPVTTTKENTTVTSLAIPMFGIVPTASSSSPATITTETPSSRILFGTTPTIPITRTTVENPTTSSTPSFFGIAATKENPITTSIPSFFSTTTTSANNSLRFATAFPLASSTSVTSITTSFVASPIFAPFSAFTPIPTTATPTTSATSSLLPSQPTTFAFGLASSASPSTTSTATPPNLFGFSTTTPKSTTAVPTSFPVTSAISASPFSNNVLSTPTTSAPLPFGGSNNFNFMPTSIAGFSNLSSFAFGAGSSLRLSTPTSIPSMATYPTSSLATSPMAVDKSASSFLPSANPTLGFGSTSNISTGAFSFSPQPSTIPVFGAGPSTLSSNTPSFGILPAVSSNNEPFQFLSAVAPNNPLSSEVRPASTTDVTPLFTIGSGSSTMNPPPRQLLRAKRHRN